MWSVEKRSWEFDFAANSNAYTGCTAIINSIAVLGYKRYQDGEQTGRDMAERVSHVSFLSRFHVSPLYLFLPYLSLPCLSPMCLSPISLSSMSLAYLTSLTLPWLSSPCLSSKRDRGEIRGNETLERGAGEERGSETKERGKRERQGRKTRESSREERHEQTLHPHSLAPSTHLQRVNNCFAANSCKF